MKRILLLALLASPLGAQTSALKGHNTDGPIEIDAARIDVQDADKKATFAGDVRIVQGTMTLNADTVTVFYARAKKGDPEIQRLDARNHVKLVTPTESAAGNTGIYDVAQKTITLIGGVTLTRGDSVLRGQRLSIDLETGRSKLDGAGTAAAPGQPATSGGRVSGRFVVPQRTGK